METRCNLNSSGSSNADKYTNTWQYQINIKGQQNRLNVHIHDQKITMQEILP